MIKGLLKKDLYNLATYKASLIIIVLFCGIAIIGTDAINIAPAIINAFDAFSIKFSSFDFYKLNFHFIYIIAI